MFRRLLGIFLFLLLGPMAAPTHAASLPLGQASSVALSGHLEMQLDPTGNLRAEEAAAGSFQPLAGNLYLGYRTGAVWLRFTLERGADAPATWWLEVEPAYLDDVRLYTPSADGGFAEQRSGGDVPVSRRDPAYRNALFPVQLDTPGARTFLLRVESRSAISAEVTAWSPTAFVTEATLGALVRGLYFGLSLMALIFYAVFWHWVREPVHGLYALYVACLGLVYSLSSGAIFLALPDLPYGIATPLRTLVICLAVGVGHHFNAVFLDLRRLAPNFCRRYLLAARLITGLGVLLILAGYVRTALSIVYPLTLLLWLMVFALVGVLWRRGEPAARLFVLGFAPVMLGVAVIFFSNLGWIPGGFWAENAYVIGSLAHVVLMSLLLFSRYNQLYRDKQAAEVNAEAERVAREEQREFMAMVSHEFRTPLAIAEATLHNLQETPSLDASSLNKVAKLQRATQRLTQLMETYLAADRLDYAEQEPNLSPCNLSDICRAVVRETAGQPGVPVELHLPERLNFVCDPDLLRIAIRNLLENARRHSPPGKTVRLSAAASDDGLRIAVLDRGEGIPADELPHIFNRYFRGRSARQFTGAGLGLHLVSTIVRRHGGRVEVRSTPGEETEFQIILPARTMRQ